MANEFLGQTVKFPFDKDANGNTLMVTGHDNLRQSVIEAISNELEGLFFQRDYGWRGNELLYEPNDEIMVDLLEVFIRDAIEKWEPRVIFQTVLFSFNTDKGITYCEVFYLVTATKKAETVVYEFKKAA